MGCIRQHSYDAIMHSQHSTLVFKWVTSILLTRDLSSGLMAWHASSSKLISPVTGFSKNLVWSSVLDELQADCIAGSYLRIAYGYTPQSPQGEGVRSFAYNIGDREYLNHDWHGNPRLRVAAVNLGMRNGEPSSCLSSKRFNYESLRGSGAEMLRQWRKR